MRPLTCVALLFAVFSLIAVSPAQPPSTTAVPNLINYSGTLVLPSGLDVSSKTVGVTFAIYRQQDGGAPLWLETQNVTPDSTGHYSVLLGSTRAEGIPADLFNTQEQRWLGVQVQGEAEQPRVLLVSVPYAMKAGDAETVGGLPPSAFVQKPPSSMAGDETVNAASSRVPGSTRPVGGGGTTNYIPIWTSNTDLGNSTIYETGGNVGIGTTAPTSMLTVAGSLSGQSVNASTTYQIGGSTVLSIGSPFRSELFLGVGAGAVNLGSNNTFTGSYAGNASITGDYNTFTGTFAGANTIGSENTFTGSFAGDSNSTGSNNTFTGTTAGYQNTTGSNNTFTGSLAGVSNRTGSNNTFSGYEAGYLNTTGSNNTFSGYEAGYLNTTGSNNTFSGYEAGSFNTTGSNNTFSGYRAGENNITGVENTFSGYLAGQLNVSGGNNTFLGPGAGQHNRNGNDNTFLGARGGLNNTSGDNNVFAGFVAGYNNTTGSQNVFLGNGAGLANTTGQNNTFLGWSSGNSNVAGTDNVYVGYTSGEHTTGSSNIYLGEISTALSESNSIRIGAQGNGLGQQNVTYIAGIYGSTSSSGVTVYINSNGQLGTLTSSIRFKEQIRDMGDSSGRLMKLRPVTFRYKPEYDKGERTLQYGLIAEEVAEVYPDLVAYDSDGKPYTVKYQYLTTMLLNEMQKQYHRAEAEAVVITKQEDKIEAQQSQITTQQQQIDHLQQRLSRLESLIAKK